MRSLLRFLGLIALAGGFSALVVDGTRSIADSSVTFMHFSDTLRWLLPVSSEAVVSSVDQQPLPLNGGLALLYSLPTGAMLCGLGLMLIYFGRPRGPRIGHSSRP